MVESEVVLAELEILLDRPAQAGHRDQGGQRDGPPGWDVDDRYQTTFGPTNVGVHRVAAAVEMGEGPRTVEHHEAISPDALAGLRPERRANHLLDVARGYAQWGKPDQAAEFLVAAAALCPAEVRCRPVAQSVLRELSRRRKVENLPAPLRELAAAAAMPE